MRRRELAARLGACQGRAFQCCCQDRLAPEQLDAPLPALGGSFLLGLDDLVMQKFGVFGVAQMLEAGRAAEVQVDHVGQIAVFAVEEADRLGWRSAAGCGR